MTVFRQVPPWTTVCIVLGMLNLPSQFPFTFQKTDISLDQNEAAAAILEPYYIPSRARRFLDYTDQLKWVTILRHCLGPHGYELATKETTRNGKKTILYTVQRVEGPIEKPITIDFS